MNNEYIADPIERFFYNISHIGMDMGQGVFYAGAVIGFAIILAAVIRKL